MPKSSQRKRRVVSEMQPTSQKLDVIDSWLQKMLDRFPAKGNLTTSEIEDWHRDLGAFSLDAIEFAFDKMRMGLFFPLNKSVLDLCISYDPPEQKSTFKCDPDCKAHHGKGYHWNDFFWMMTKLRAPCVVGPDGNPRTERATEVQIEALLTECDKKRPQGSPEFRK